jgi:hypothetical protein
MNERRTARRYHLSLPVTICVSAEKEAFSRRGLTKDISSAGVYFIIGNDLNPGVPLDLTMTLPAAVTGGTEVFIRVNGNVARVDKNPDNCDQTVGIAFMIRRYAIVRNEASSEAVSR